MGRQPKLISYNFNISGQQQYRGAVLDQKRYQQDSRCDQQKNFL